MADDIRDIIREEIAAAMREHRIDLSQLPIQDLQRAIETTWLPDAKTFLLRGSIGTELLDDDVSAQLLAGVPTGALFMWYTATAPTGYLLCDGAAVSRTTYADLFAVIGTVAGAGDGSTTFNVPNYKGKAAVGLDSAQTEFDALHETGGAKTHTLITGEIPAHSHGVTDPGHTHDWKRGAAAGGGATAWASSTEDFNVSPAVDSRQTGISIQNAGGGGAHNNLQPYRVSNFIIKT